MINPNRDDFVEDNPLAAPTQHSTGQTSSDEQANRGSTIVPGATAETWQETGDERRGARQRSQIFVRENPVPVIVGALALGLAIGWALRHATREEKELEVKTPLGDFNWSFFSLPFLWPFFRSMKEKYADSADTIKDVAREGVERVRKIDIDRYAKPLRKRWKSWTR